MSTRDGTKAKELMYLLGMSRDHSQPGLSRGKNKRWLRNYESGAGRMGRELGAGMCTAKEVNMDKIGYKAFNPGMICRGKQYEENAVFEEPEAKICNTGMHYCKNPFDVLAHYGFVNDNAEINEFAEVEALADEKTDDGRKFCECIC